MRDAFVGVDVAFAKRKFLPVAVCSWQDGHLVPYPLRDLSIKPPRGLGNAATLDDGALTSFAARAVNYLVGVAAELDLSIQRIGIDAPSSPSQTLTRRASERALDEAGISCFATPSEAGFKAIRAKVRAHLDAGGTESHLPHANQLWMLAGFALFRELRKLAECIEVFSQATVRALGAGHTHKSKLGAVQAQAEATAKFTGWPNSSGPPLTSIAWAPAHDCLDAYLSAWVAALDERDREALGSPPDDAIWIPSVTDHAPTRTAPTAVALEQSSAPPRPPKLCPACAEMQFKRWPWGWDAHAAYTCPALKEGTPEERKQEFRQRFGAHFND